MNKTLFPPSTTTVRPAVKTLLLAFSLAFCFGLPGCRSSGPDPSAFNTPPTDAYALSGGKITRFTPMPGLPGSSTDKAMLLACRQLPLTSHTARSAFLVVTAGQFGRVPISGLVVGNQVFMLPGDFVTMGMDHGLGFSHESAPERGVGGIMLTSGSRIATVGQKRMVLHDPVLFVANEGSVMNWADLLALFQERDRQRHQPPFIRNVQIIYDLRDYHR